MHGQHFFDLLADTQHRIERCHRLLKDHRNPLCAKFTHLVGAGGGDFKAFQIDQTALHFESALGQKPHDRERCDRLARPAFAHKTMRFTRADIEVDLVKYWRGIRATRQADCQLADLQNALCVREVL